jgi:hypothetical protein
LGPYLLAPLFELGLPRVQIEGIIEVHNFGSQTFALKAVYVSESVPKDHVVLGCENISRVALISLVNIQVPEFACSCSSPWVVWSLVHFVSWLVTGFMIFSLSAWWTCPESLLFNVNFLRKQQTPTSTCKCELVTSLVCLVAG